MRIKFLLPAALLLAGNPVSAGDRLDDSVSSAATSKVLRTVKIGPEAYILPPAPPKVDSAQVLRLSIDESYRKRKSQDITVSFYTGLQKIKERLQLLQVYPGAAAMPLPNLESLLNSSRFATDTHTQYLVQNSLAHEYLFRGQGEKAGVILKQSMMLAEQTADKDGLLLLAGAIAELAKLNGNYGEALNYQQSILTTAASQRANKLLAGAYLSIAGIHTLKQEYALAENLIIKKALPFYRGYKPGRMSCFEELTDLYLRQNRFSEAKWYCLQAKSLAEQLRVPEVQVLCLSRLATIKAAEGDSENALKDLRAAERLASQYKYADLLIGIKGDIGDIYRKLGDYTAAESLINEYRLLSKNYLHAAR